MTAAELKAARERLGLTQVEFAALIGASSNSTVAKWELGKRAVPKAVEIILASAKPKR